MFKKANEIFADDQIRCVRGVGTVKFIRWFDGDFQLRGYFVLEFPDLSAEILTMYQTEEVFLLTDLSAT